MAKKDKKAKKAKKNKKSDETVEYEIIVDSWMDHRYGKPPSYLVYRARVRDTAIAGSYVLRTPFCDSEVEAKTKLQAVVDGIAKLATVDESVA